MAGNYGFLSVDVKDLVREYDKRSGDAGGSGSPAPEPLKKEEEAPPPSRAEEIASNEIGDESREREIRNAVKAAKDEEAERMRALADVKAGLEVEKEKKEKIEISEFQSAISSAVRASIALNSVQRMVAINNQVNMRRGVGKDPGDGALKKAFSKDQLSTIKVKTPLARSVGQLIGPLSARANQDLLMNSFLYWFFGRPTGIEFEESQWPMVNEILEKLDINASPVRMAQAGANTSEAMLDKLDIMNQRMDGVARLLELFNKDLLGIRTQTGKIYLADCYMLLNLWMRTEPVPRDLPLEDVDIMAGGKYWQVDAGIADALQYVGTTNGREIYKAKHGVKVPTYKPPVPVQSASYEPVKGMYDPVDDIKPDEGEQDDDYEDIPDDFDPLNDDFDDMGIGSDFNPAYMSDPDYDDGIEEGSPEYFKKKREEALLREKAMSMDAGQDWNDED